jgi:predicted nucleic acid-binding protein
MSELDPIDPLCFVDTNIWLYAFINGPDTAKSNRARQLIRDHEGSVAVSSQVINEICVNLLKKTQMKEAELRELVRAFYQKYPVVLLDQPVQIGASELRARFSLSFWDSLILAAAVHCGATILYSEDLQAGLKVADHLTICNPFGSSGDA